MVEVEKTTQEVLDKISEALCPEGSLQTFRQNGISISLMVTVNISRSRRKQINRELMFSLMERHRERRYSFQ